MACEPNTAWPVHQHWIAELPQKHRPKQNDFGTAQTRVLRFLHQITAVPHHVHLGFLILVWCLTLLSKHGSNLCIVEVHAGCPHAHMRSLSLQSQRQHTGVSRDSRQVAVTCCNSLAQTTEQPNLLL